MARIDSAVTSRVSKPTSKVDLASLAWDTVASSHPIMVVVLDARMIVRWASPGMLAKLPDAVEKPITALIHPDDIGDITALVATLGEVANELVEDGIAEMGQGSIQTRLVTPTGDMHIEARGIWKREQGELHLVVHIRDITKTTRAVEILGQVSNGGRLATVLPMIGTYILNNPDVDGCAFFSFGITPRADLLWTSASEPPSTMFPNENDELAKEIGRVASNDLSAQKFTPEWFSDDAGWSWSWALTDDTRPLGAMVMWGGRDVNPAVANNLASIPRHLGELALVRHRDSWDLYRHTATDALTGLMSRQAFLGRLQSAAATEPALLSIDLGDFKALTDNHGHEVGETVLKLAGMRISATVRAGDIVARLSGDRFSVLAANITRDEAEVLADRLLSSLGAPFSVADTIVEVETNIGISMPEDNNRDNDAKLLPLADRALTAARTEGIGRFHTMVASKDESNSG